MDIENVNTEANESVEQQELAVAQLSDEELQEMLSGKEPKSDEAEEEQEEPKAEAEEEPEGEETEEKDDDKEEADEDELTVEKLQAQVDDFKKIIGRQGNDIGALRKREAELLSLISDYVNREPSEDDTPDWADPRKVARDEYGRIEAKKVLGRVKEEAIEKAKAAIHNTYPEFDQNLIVEAMKADGVDDSTIAAWTGDLFRPTEDPGQDRALLIHAQYQRGMLIKQNAELQKKIAELETKATSAKKSVIENLQKASKRKTPATVAAGTAGVKEGKLDVKQIASLSYDELQELLERKK